MCYGSGCSNETRDGECDYISKRAYKLIKESEFKSSCVVYGCMSEILMFYLTKEEYLEMERQLVYSWKYNSISTTEYYENIAYSRWRDDNDRLQLIRELNKELVR